MESLFATMLVLAQAPAAPDRDSSVRHLELRPTVAWTGPADGARWESGQIEPGIPWTELVPSWDVHNTEGGGTLALSIRMGGQVFQMGIWGLNPLRKSINDQKNDTGVVYTDTLMTRTPGAPFEVLVRLTPNLDGSLPQLRSVTLSLSAGLPAPAAWSGRPIEPLAVPIRAQGDYPNGGVLCSPTSVSMVLQYWSQQLERPQLDSDVPIVQANVFDPSWGGTGNWTFNAAYAATKPGIRARVARLRDLADLESWLRAGVPVITSVSYDLLKGKSTRGENDGHLVIVVGINEQGQLIFNDPGKKPIRLVYERDAFLRAWATSRNTVYLIHPQSWVTPPLP